MRYFWVGIFLVIAGTAFGTEERFPSGLLKNYHQPQKPTTGLRSARRGMPEFIAANFGRNAPDFEWRQLNERRTGPLTNHRFQLFLHGRRVADQILKVHYHRDGYVWSASSNWKEAARPLATRSSPKTRSDLEANIRADYFRRWGVPFLGTITIDPVVWINPGTSAAVNAYEVTYGTWRPFESRRFFVDEKDLSVLMEMRTRRHVTQAAKVWDVNPDRTAHISRTLTNLTVATSLITLDSTLHVWRVEQDGTARNVAPNVDFSAEGGFDDTDPANYNTACVGALNTSCPNQGADAVNVYFHVNGFREALTTHFTALGVTPTLNDPLDVFVNFPIDDGSGGFVANNAFYNSTSCGSGVDRCLLFLYPDTDDDAACGGGFVNFFDLAREGNVAIHEYQHYMTDQVAGFVGSGTSSANIGDAVHEGYSDYFGASHVATTATANAVATTGAPVIGEYGFQECTFYARDISVLRPVQHTAAERADEHLVGHSFASGLWDLRTTYGATIVDRIAIQSLFIVPADPGSLDVVESLVQADELLYAGAHVAEIRDVFYTQIGFLPVAGSLRDGSRGIVELGMRSCAAIHTQGNFSGSGFLALAWLFGLLSAGRFFARRAECKDLFS